MNRELTRVGFVNQGIQERPNLAVLRRTDMPAVLVEVGFINTDKDNIRFDTQFREFPGQLPMDC
ncbi:MAG: N-acetylmuramoyl-L-alanine amidase [Lachnospiraceae bacterium]